MLALEKMDIVGGSQTEIELAGNAHQTGKAAPLRLQTMVVQFDKKVFPSQNIPILAGDAQGAGRIADK